jgi:hypothetical protein
MREMSFLCSALIVSENWQQQKTAQTLHVSKSLFALCHYIKVRNLAWRDALNSLAVKDNKCARRMVTKAAGDTCEQQHALVCCPRAKDLRETV